MEPQLPTIGRIVVYRSKTGDFDLAAIVAATAGTLHAGNVAEGRIPALDDEMHVHLVVFSPGLPGKADLDAVRRVSEATPEHLPMDVNMGGTFREWNIPYDGPNGPEAVTPREWGEVVVALPGTWRWPERA